VRRIGDGIHHGGVVYGVEHRFDHSDTHRQSIG
jgi:hypothetical protein